MLRRLALTAAATALLVAVVNPAGAVIPGVGVISKKNMEWVFNWPAAVGSDIEFLEKKLEDGSLKRYAIIGSMGNGFNVIDITNPALPVLTGVFVDPGLNWQGDIQVNPKRNLVVLATQSPGATVSHGASDGLAFVDVSDPSRPTLLGVVNGLGGAAHNSTIIDDRYIYTTGAARMVDYQDPRNPVEIGQIPGMCAGHDITVDPNRPIAYNACANANTEIWNVADARNPVKIATITDSRISIAHQADPSPDSSLLFITDERGGGLTNVNAPGGGIHVYDISGKYIPGASLQTPRKLGGYWPPFNGVAASSTSSGVWGNLTAHNMTFQAERWLLSIGWYTMGSWVTDLQYPTNDTGPYQEWKGTHASNGGPTTWGNTQGNILLEGDEVWSAKWTRFDDPLFDRYVFNSGITRGFDVLRYTGAMPQKVARLTVNGAATDGAVTGVLDRYAVWTYEGWVNKPLAGKTLSVSVDGGPKATVVTGADGSFSADLGLGAGSHEVTVTWTDASGTYQTARVTKTVTA
jgi:hypothetical protein